ncbi:MAG: MGMT family protein [Deltaproteobacteria bacterium]|nr:MGMT family protein [Nannocystaceae bacterium]
MSPSYRRIYATVTRIPAGRVASYGQIAQLAGLPGGARQVGYALHAIPEGTNLPWHRVVNARGEISLDGEPAREQKQRLRREGVRFDARDRIDLRAFGWTPGTATRKRRTTARGVGAARG